MKECKNCGMSIIQAGGKWVHQVGLKKDCKGKNTSASPKMF